MRSFRPFLCALGLLHPLHGQAQPTAPIVPGLLAEWRIVGEKTLTLARAFPAHLQDWRASPETRSVREVIVHIAGSNYWLAAAAGVPAPAATGLRGDDEATAIAYDSRRPVWDRAIAELAASITHVEQNLGAIEPGRLDMVVMREGRSTTVFDTWLHTVTHAHEHLGQLIAYARANGIVPPWSR